MASIPASLMVRKDSRAPAQARRVRVPGSSRRPSVSQARWWSVEGRSKAVPSSTDSQEPEGISSWRKAGSVQRKPWPWGPSRPLWPPQAKALAPDRSGRAVPAPWMPSTTRRTPLARQPAPRAARSSLSPSWKRTQETASTWVAGASAARRRASGSTPARGGAEAQASEPARWPSHRGTSRKRTPRASMAFQGQMLLGNSPSGASTSSPRLQRSPWATVTRPEEVEGVRVMSEASPPTIRAASSRRAAGTPR